MESKLIKTLFVTLALYFTCTSCAVTDAVLDYPMSFFDEETGETVEPTVGDAIADNSDGFASVVSNTLGGVHPGLALLGGGAAAALFGGARRKKKAAQVIQTASPAEEPEVKG